MESFSSIESRQKMPDNYAEQLFIKYPHQNIHINGKNSHINTNTNRVCWFELESGTKPQLQSFRQDQPMNPDHVIEQEPQKQQQQQQPMEENAETKNRIVRRPSCDKRFDDVMLQRPVNTKESTKHRSMDQECPVHRDHVNPKVETVSKPEQQQQQQELLQERQMNESNGTTKQDGQVRRGTGNEESLREEEVVERGRGETLLSDRACITPIDLIQQVLFPHETAGDPSLAVVEQLRQHVAIVTQSPETNIVNGIVSAALGDHTEEASICPSVAGRRPAVEPTWNCHVVSPVTPTTQCRELCIPDPVVSLHSMTLRRRVQHPKRNLDDAFGSDGEASQPLASKQSSTASNVFDLTIVEEKEQVIVEADLTTNSKTIDVADVCHEEAPQSQSVHAQDPDITKDTTTHSVAPIQHRNESSAAHHALPNSGADHPMRIIPPPAPLSQPLSEENGDDESSQDAQDQYAVGLLRRLNEILQLDWMPSKLDVYLNSNASGRKARGTSLRRIQGGRIEIYCRAKGKKTIVFDWLCEILARGHQEDGKVKRPTKRTCQKQDQAVVNSEARQNNGKAIKATILEYAMRQARRDPRVGRSHRNYAFDNFSLLVSYGEVKMQAIHMDLQEPNHQFGLLLTSQAAPTLVYQPAYQIRSVSALEQAWPDLPAPLKKCMTRSKSVTELLQQFGDLLCPVIEACPLPGQNTMTTGTLLSLPGSVIHAGPPSDAFRAIMFFSGWPNNGHDAAISMEDSSDVTSAEISSSTKETVEDIAVAPYDPDIQYTTPLLMCDLAVLLLPKKIPLSDRVYLLNKLVDAIQKSTTKDLFRHLSDPPMIDFTKGIERGMYLNNLQDFIATFATRGVVQLPKLPIVVPGDLERVSVDSLVASRNGEWCDIQVYKYRTKEFTVNTDANNSQPLAAVVYYPAENLWIGRQTNECFNLFKSTEHSSLTTVLGIKVIVPPKKGKRCALLSSTDKTVWFDGTNGILVDSRGKIIPCSRTKGLKQKQPKAVKNKKSP